MGYSKKAKQKAVIQAALSHISDFIQEDKDFREYVMEMLHISQTDEGYELVNDAMEILGAKLSEVSRRIK